MKIEDAASRKRMEESMRIDDLIVKATFEAQKRGIEANMIVIDAGIAYSRIPAIAGIIPYDVPLLCGLKVVLDGKNELPDDVAFALLHAENPPKTNAERIKELEAENEALRRTLRKIGKLTQKQEAAEW